MVCLSFSRLFCRGENGYRKTRHVQLAKVNNHSPCRGNARLQERGTEYDVLAYITKWYAATAQAIEQLSCLPLREEVFMRLDA